MFFINFLRTPLTGASQLVATSFVTPLTEIGTTLAASAWTWVTCKSSAFKKSVPTVC